MINAVIDISHHNGAALDFAEARDDGILGVIHKASQGQSGRDPMYLVNRRKAEAAGLLWGAYHFGTGSSSGAIQAMNFLGAVSPVEGTLLVLDLEPNPHGPSMTLQQARDFVTYIHDHTGQWPGLYSGHYIRELLGQARDPLLANCWLWLAQYAPHAVTPPNWPTWTMWQYTDGAAGPGPHAVAGIGHCDRDMFNGTEPNLRRLWGLA